MSYYYPNINHDNGRVVGNQLHVQIKLLKVQRICFSVSLKAIYLSLTLDIVPLRKSRSGHIVNLKKSVTVFGAKDTQEANLFMFSRIWREELRENRIQKRNR